MLFPIVGGASSSTTPSNVVALLVQRRPERRSWHRRVVGKRGRICCTHGLLLFVNAANSVGVSSRGTGDRSHRPALEHRDRRGGARPLRADGRAGSRLVLRLSRL